MLRHAGKEYKHLKLIPADILSTTKCDSTWAASLTRINAFRLTTYLRVLYFHSDFLVLNTMDRYSLASMSRLAVLRVYWPSASLKSVAEQTLCSHIMLLQPDLCYYTAIMNETQRSSDFDMEIVNHLFKKSAMPHRWLALLIGKFRTRGHADYTMEEPNEEWNAHAEVSRGVTVHFSERPLSKPWRAKTKSQWDNALPECDLNDERDNEREDRS